MMQRLLGSALCIVAFGCSDGGAADDNTGSRAALGGTVRCTWVYRQSNEGTPGQEGGTDFTERVLAVGPNEAFISTLGKLDFRGKYFSDQFEGSNFSMNVAAGEKSVFGSLYQFGNALPANQFAGGHGFTGLIYLTHPTEGGDYQLWCQTVP